MGADLVLLSPCPPRRCVIRFACVDFVTFGSCMSFKLFSHGRASLIVVTPLPVFVKIDAKAGQEVCTCGTRDRRS